MNDGCTPCRATRAGTQAPPLPISIISFHASHINQTTIYTQSSPATPTVHVQSTQTKSPIPCAIRPNDINHPHAIRPNETVGAVPACPPERPRSGVSIQKYTHCARGDERCMRPCRATRAGTQAPPLPIPTKPCGVPLPHHIIHSIAHANRTVCSYPTVLHIRQLQTMRCAPTPSGLYFR